MKVTTKLHLPPDVVVAPVASLSPELIRRLDHEAGDFYVARTHIPSEFIVVNTETAALLEQFRAPSTVVDAMMAFCRANELDPRRTLDEAYVTLSDLVSAGVLVPLEPTHPDETHAAPREGSLSAIKQWATYRYYDIYRNQFSEHECDTIISLQNSYSMVASKIDYQSGDTIRDCNLFWIPRNDGTEWIFSRLFKVAAQFNRQYGFEVSPYMGSAQLTRYMPGQQYNWHMDLGAKEASLRKITLVLQLSANKDMHGGGTEIFYGDLVDNRIHADIGDVVVFPSFVMHRASVVHSEVRWSLVVWLLGPRPLR